MSSKAALCVVAEKHKCPEARFFSSLGSYEDDSGSDQGCSGDEVVVADFTCKACGSRVRGRCKRHRV